MIGRNPIRDFVGPRWVFTCLPQGITVVQFFRIEDGASLGNEVEKCVDERHG